MIGKKKNREKARPGEPSGAQRTYQTLPGRRFRAERLETIRVAKEKQAVARVFSVIGQGGKISRGRGRLLISGHAHQTGRKGTDLMIGITIGLAVNFGIWFGHVAVRRIDYVSPF